MNKRKALEEKIRELVPELMELTFGCKIVTGKDRRMFHRNRRSYSGPEQGGITQPAIGKIVSFAPKKEFKYDREAIPAKFYCVSPDNTAPWHTPTDKPEKIIGHPIYIGNILKAARTLKIPLGIDWDGGFMVYGKMERLKWWDEEVYWQLGKPLSEQRPEVWDFLYTILIKKS